jgi:GAF domain-containing protein
VRPRNSSAAGEETKVAQLTRERDAALEQQSATSEVLRIISASRGELESVFQTMLERAVRICEAKLGALYRLDGKKLHLAAQVGASKELAEFRASRGSFQPAPDGLLDRVLRTKRVNYVADQTNEGRMIATKTVVHVVDVAAEPAHPKRDPWSVAGAELAGVRTLVGVPMMKENEVIGAFTIYRQEVRPFTEKQIAPTYPSPPQ